MGRKSVFLLFPPSFTFLLGKKQTGASLSSQTTVSSIVKRIREMNLRIIHIKHLKRKSGWIRLYRQHIFNSKLCFSNNNCLMSKKAWNAVRYSIIPTMLYSSLLSNWNTKMHQFLKRMAIWKGINTYYFNILKLQRKEIWIYRCPLHFTFMFPHFEMKKCLVFFGSYVLFLIFCFWSFRNCLWEQACGVYQIGYHFYLHRTYVLFLLQNWSIFYSACHTFFPWESGWFS